MRENLSLLGSDILGAPTLTVRLRDPRAVVEAKGGSPGWVAAKVAPYAPQAFERLVYDQMAGIVKGEAAKQGIALDTAVVDPAPTGKLSWPDVGTGAVLGVGGVGLVYGAVKLVKYLIRRR